MASSKTQSTADAVYDAIKADILTFRLRPGEVLAEEALSRHHQVSRTPVRDALRRLEHEGLSETRGRSRIVRIFNVTAYEGIYQVRLALEDLAVQDAISRASDAQIQELAETWAGETPISQVPEDGRFVLSDEVFHVGIARLTGNEYLIDALESVNDRIRVLRRLDFTTHQRIQATYEEHTDLLRLMQQRDVPAVREAMNRHIEMSKEKIRQRLTEIVMQSYLDPTQTLDGSLRKGNDE